MPYNRERCCCVQTYLQRQNIIQTISAYKFYPEKREGTPYASLVARVVFLGYMEKTTPSGEVHLYLYAHSCMW